MQVFVMLADPQGMILESKEFYAPIITPYEAYVAFSPDTEWTGEYQLDFSAVLVSIPLVAQASEASSFSCSMHTGATSNHGSRGHVGV